MSSTMNEIKSSPWVASLESVFTEHDPKKLIERIALAEATIDARLFDLRNDSDHHEERQLITDAQCTLRFLRREQEALEICVRERTADLKKSEQNLHRLASRLFYARDDERRRIARELHDSVGQVLTAITMDIAIVQQDSERLSPKAAQAMSDMADLVRQVLREVRTVSYLLHPPLLDECGLLSAVRWYAEGFSERSNIKVTLDLDEDLGRLPRELETTIFRVLQECLTNIHRHSKSKTARIRILRCPKEVRMEVSDEGIGIPADKIADMRSASGDIGVGTTGMRERIGQFGGELEIASENGHGTVVTATIPWQEDLARAEKTIKSPVKFWAKLGRLVHLRSS
jgi:signal transduction histidine kinase